MLWVIVALLVIFFVFGVAGVRNALKIAAVLFAVFVVLVVGYLAVQKSEEVASKSRISLSEVQFDDLRLAINGTNSRLTGTIRNNSSKYTLFDAELLITVKDCVQGKCDVVGQDSVNLWGLGTIPPGQIRAIDQSVYFSSMPPRRGDYEWTYQIKTLKGRS